MKNTPHFLIIFIATISLVFLSKAVSAQVTDSLERLKKEKITVNLGDSAVSDTIKKDTLRKKKDGIQTTIKYSAKDSIKTRIIDQIVTLYGEATVTYGDVKIESEEIEINWKTNIVKARGKIDSTGELYGTPLFTQGGENYESEEISYNFKTGKGIISKVITKQGESYIQGIRSKRDSDGTIYSNPGIFTTCDLPEPHFSIRANRIKMVPDKVIVTGPFNMYVGKTPTPLGFLFGMFPNSSTRRSGVVIPVYGEATDRGFFLREGGYYLAIGERVGLTMLGEIYTNGSWGLDLRGVYKKRYSYDGFASIRYNNRIGGEDKEKVVQKDFWLTWSHSPIPRGSGLFQANVNIGTSTFNRNNSFDQQARLSSSFQSNISYSKNFIGTPFNITLSARQDLNTITKVGNLTLPEFSVNMNRISPFKKKNQTAKNFIQQIGISYQASGRNLFTNDTLKGTFPFKVINKATKSDTIRDFFNDFSSIAQKSQWGVIHTIPIQTTVKLLKYFSLNPSFNYREFWYPYSFDYTWEDTGNNKTSGVRVDTLKGFTRAYDFSTSASLTTRLYGFLKFPNSKRIEAIRHTLVPAVSFSYTPDFSLPTFNFYKEVQIDTLGTKQKISRFYNFPVGGPGQNESGSISFSLNNIFEMKLRAKSDTGKATKINLLENLSLSGSYNFLADSLQLSPISVAARTRLLQIFDINSSASFDPYTIISEGVSGTAKRINRYAFSSGQGLGRLTSLNLSIGASFTPKNFKDITKRKREELLGNTENPRSAAILGDPDNYMDFEIPWTLRLNYIYSWSRSGFETPNVTQTIGISGDLSITKTWKIAFNTNYDIKTSQFGLSSVDIVKDLHCWEMRFNWVPFGIYQSYNFDIYIKSSLLKDLKISRRRSWYDRGPVDVTGTR